MSMERLPLSFKSELAKLYTSFSLSGAIPSSRHAHVMGEITKLRRKYDRKLHTARSHLPARVVDAAERQVTNIEVEMRRIALTS
jgi:hypothetical protein